MYSSNCECSKWKINITTRLAAVTTTIVAGTIIVCSLMVSAFLERFYIDRAEKNMRNVYSQLRQAQSEGLLDKKRYDADFEHLCNAENVNIIVLTQEGEIVRSSYANAEWFLHEMQQLIGGNYESAVLVYRTDEFMIQHVTDDTIRSDCLMGSGILPDGNYVFIRTSLEGIRGTAIMTNRFFVQIGIIAVSLCFVVILFTAKKISKPIKELTQISREMRALNFEVKFSAKEHYTREIDELGCNMNEMSQVLERTISELKAANIELQTDIQKKEEIDEMRKEFVSNVSHELKTPLALIRGYAEGLRDGIGDGEQDREYYCDVIVDEAEKMNNMVRKLLTLNQLEFGHEMVDISRFNITEMINGILQGVRLLADQNGITIEADDLETLYVWGDALRIEDVISNYLTNAINHADGRKQIRFFYTRYDKLVRISVFNTGKQIPESELDKIWEKFYKVDKARSRSYGGSGIGLSIVKAIMDYHHQQCGVVNHMDGVEFYFELECDK